MDIATIGGFIFAIFCILFGQALEGGHASSLVQATAAIIVIGGTIGAVMVANPMKDFMAGVKAIKVALKNPKHDLGKIINDISELAALARRDGVLALEQRLQTIEDPFMKRSVGFLVDGVDSAVARDALETEIFIEFEEGVVAAKVWESGGGFAPTVGILGAVLGLIHVMENLSDPSKLGGGIATAFVATVYGVGAANLIFLPIAGKLKRRLAVEKERKTIIAEGVLSIQAGLNPRVIEEKLKSYAGGHVGSHAPAKK
jgi:chemotaxis protein MotA